MDKIRGKSIHSSTPFETDCLTFIRPSQFQRVHQARATMGGAVVSFPGVYGSTKPVRFLFEDDIFVVRAEPTRGINPR